MRDIDIFLNKISVKRLAEYLRINNWIEIDSLYGGRVLQFINPEGTNGVLLPVDNSFVDYDQAVQRALEIIAASEKTSLKNIYSKLMNPSCDILKWRIADDSTVNGSISFNSMGANIDHIKDLISSTCQDILMPGVFHAKVNTKDVQDQMAKYSFGQTEIGSYILNILCPLGYYQYQLFNPETEGLPLSRKINLKILESINSIQNSIEDGSSQADEIVAEGKVSVNFLSALSDLYNENKDSDLTISAAWNPHVPLLTPDPVSAILLKPRCIDKVNQIIEDNTPIPEREVEKAYVGKIVNIGAEAEVGNRETVNIKVAVITDGGRLANILVSLKYSDYFDIANNAFQNGLDVRVKGLVAASVKQIKLLDATIETL